MLTYIVRRLLYSIPVLLLASFLVFVGVSLVSHPLAFLHQNPRLTPQQIATITHAKGLDQPVVVRYWNWLQDAVLHKFGNNLLNGNPIWPELQRVLGHTAVLISLVILLSLIIGVSIGIYSAVRQYSVFDYTATTVSFVGFAMPVFWLGLMLQVLFTNIYLHFGVRIFYTAQLSRPGANDWLLDRAQHLALPVITLSALQIAQYSRYMRAQMLEVINSDYTRTARAKGLTERLVIGRHVVRNALIPVVTQVAYDFGQLIGGAIVTETVFSIDGMGYYFIQALFRGDPYPIMAWLMVAGLGVILFNLAADVLYGVLDPRIRYD